MACRPFGGPVDDAEPPSSALDGFDAAIHFVRFRGPALPSEWTQPLVARVARDATRLPICERAVRVQEWCAAHGYPTARMVALLRPDEALARPVQIMTRAPGVTMRVAITRAPLARPATRRPARRAAAELHALPTEAWVDDATLLDNRLALVRSMVAQEDHPILSRGVRAVEALAPQLEVAHPVVCHGDYHPLNVLVAGDRFNVLDRDGAGLGDRHGDVSRSALLFEVATAFVTGPTRAVAGAFSRSLRRRYLAAYERRAPLDRARLALWEPVHLFQLWAQAVFLDRPSRSSSASRPTSRRRWRGWVSSPRRG
jgi:aminoglycoside phosphotransferase (APT) family kinase protein